MDIKQLYDIYKRADYKVTTDSRAVPQGAVFFGLKGERFDGNSFAADALKKGARIAIIDNPEYFINPQKTVLVQNTLETLWQLATFHRKQLNVPVLALTGTAGKTTTKELIIAVLAQKFKVKGTVGNLNNHIGLPLTLLSIKPGQAQILVLEMGASKPGDIEILCNIADPDYGLITNIGTAHLEGFGSRQVLIHTKTAIYRHLEKKNGLIFINADDQLLMSLTNHSRLYTYGTTGKAKTKGNFIELNPFLKFYFIGTDGKKQTVQTQLFGKYNLYNALAAIAIGQYFQVSDSLIKQAIENYTPKNQRSQIHKTQHNTLILDLYNANPTSMSEALRSFSQINHPDKVLILGDMLELGEIELDEHKKILQLAEQLGFTEIYLVGQIFGKVNTKYPHFESSEKLAQWLKQNPIKNRFILLKASRGIKLETVIDYL